MSATQIVPFGKYKGQPVEALSQDRAYCEWLMAQDWFRARFATIHTLIVNNFGAPSETPEHNLLQARFLDPDFVVRFLAARANVSVFHDFRSTWKHVVKEREKLLVQTRCAVDDMGRDPDAIARARARARCAEQALLAEWEPVKDLISRVDRSTVIWSECRTQFEDCGVDVRVSGRARFDPPIPHIGDNPQFSWWSDPPYRSGPTCIQLDGFHYEVAVECKPLLGDDYPAVLRQMRAAEADTLLIEDCAAIVSLEQIRAIFAPLRVLTRSEVEAR